jgi:hypothetical protein
MRLMPIALVKFAQAGTRSDRQNVRALDESPREKNWFYRITMFAVTQVAGVGSCFVS